MRFLYGSIVVLAIAISNSTHADYLDTDGILRKDNGTIHAMTQYQAMGVDSNGNEVPMGPACPAGTHLPTAREQALFSQQLGARGILELQENQRHCPSQYFFKVSAINPEGTKDEFCFSELGYRCPTINFENWFWSSSVLSLDSRKAYGLSGDTGIVGDGYRNNYGVVRCISNY